LFFKPHTGFDPAIVPRMKSGMKSLDVRTVEDLLAFLKRQRTSSRIIARTAPGLPIYSFKLGGRRKPAIVIKAGSHASEIGAIHGALRLLEEGLESEHEIHLIPCACPQDFAGYNYLLSWASGKKVNLATDADCWQALESLGRKFYERKHDALYRVGELVFGYVDQRHTDPRALAYGELDRLSQADPQLAYELGGRRIIFPNFIFHKEQANSYDQGALVCCANWEGWVGNPNRFYDNFEPPLEVRCVRELCEQVKPGLIIDMHESAAIRKLKEGGRKATDQIISQQHYLVLPPVHGPRFEEIETPVAEGALKSTRAAGFAPLDQKTLAKGWGFGKNAYFNGYVRSDQRPIIAFYQWGMRYEASIVVESGMNQPLKDRCAIQAAAVRGAIAAYAKLKRP
jgi:hypothetical protein